MVKLHVKHNDESQFLLETTVTIPIDQLINQIALIYNGRLKVHRICNGKTKSPIQTILFFFV